MNITDIKISDNFLAHPPKPEKIEMKKKNSFDEVGNQICTVKLDKNNILIDGYATLLAAKELGYEKVWVKGGKNMNLSSYRTEPTTYIYGTHPNSNCNKEFMWRIPKTYAWMTENLQIGDTVLCGTKFGISPVIVTKIETLDKCPTELVVKKVVGKNIMRNGVIVEV